MSECNGLYFFGNVFWCGKFRKRKLSKILLWSPPPPRENRRKSLKMAQKRLLGEKMVFLSSKTLFSHWAKKLKLHNKIASFEVKSHLEASFMLICVQNCLKLAHFHSKSLILAILPPLITCTFCTNMIHYPLGNSPGNPMAPFSNSQNDVIWSHDVIMTSKWPCHKQVAKKYAANQH